MSDPRYPIGKFTFDGPPNEAQRSKFIDDIEHDPCGVARRDQESLPAADRNPLSRRRLDGSPGCPSRAREPHERLHAFQAGAHRGRTHRSSRTWKTAGQDTPEVKSTPLEVSLALLESLHDRWVRLLRTLKPEDWKRTFRHPELGLVPLEKNLALYAWHGKHHVAHITELRKRMGW